MFDRQESNKLPGIEENKQIIWDIHQEYQIGMDKQTKLKKKKSPTMPTQLAIPPKFQMKPALIINTTRRQAPVTMRDLRTFSSETVDLMLLSQVMGPDPDFCDGYCCSRNRRCRAVQLV
uniref:Uncharacterized protein n=1 Tax=Romanomermis culicivorax TaxID=13658 RepID=A0A915IQC4_ROMCU